MAGNGTAFLSANAFASLGLESTRGTAAASPTDIPVNGPAMSPMITWLKDDAMRGSPVSQYDDVPGPRADDLDLKCYGYEDSLPILLMSALGTTDTKTGSGPYVHTIGLANSASTASQPLSVTGVLFDAANAWQITAAQCVSLDIASGADKALDITAKYTGNPWTKLSSTPTPTWGTVPLIPSWNTTVSIAGSQVYFVETLDLKIDRKSAPIFTEAQQGPYVVFAGPIEVTGKLTCVVATNADPFTVGSTPYALSRDAVALVATLTNPATSGSVAFTMTNTQFKNPKRQVSKLYTTIDVDFVALADTTDATASGYSPIKTVTTNSVSTAYVGS